MLKVVPGIKYPVLEYFYSEEVKEMKVGLLGSDFHVALANGFFCARLTEESAKVLLNNPLQEPNIVKEWVGEIVIFADRESVTKGFLNEEEFQAVLLHEEGHLFYGHLDDAGTPVTGQFTIIDNLDEELQCDAYACLQVPRHVMANGLKKCIKMAIRRTANGGWDAFKRIIKVMSSEATQARLKNLRPDAP